MKNVPAFVAVGQSLPRTDGRLKVTGSATYTAEHPVEAFYFSISPLANWAAQPIRLNIRLKEACMHISSVAGLLPGELFQLIPQQPQHCRAS